MLAPSEHNHCLSTGMRVSVAFVVASLSRHRHCLVIGSGSVSYRDVAGDVCREMSCCATSLERATHGRNMSSQSGAPGGYIIGLLWSLPILKSHVLHDPVTPLDTRRIRMQVDDAVAAVRDFHLGTGAPIAERPRLLPGDRLAAETLAGQLSSLKSSINTAGGGMLVQRAAMAIEELAEWLLAHANGDLVAAADAWADRAYVLFGDAVAAGLPAAELFAEVHREQHDQGTGRGRHRQSQKGSRLQAARTWQPF